MKSVYDIAQELHNHPDCVYVFVLTKDDVVNFDPDKKRDFGKTMDNLISDDWTYAAEEFFGGINEDE